MQPQNVSEQIFNHAIKSITPFASESGATWAIVPTGPFTHEAWSIASTQFRDWLAHSFFAECSLFPGPQSIRHAVHMLQARARYDSAQPHHEVFTRIAWSGHPLRPEALSIDLATPGRETVEITSTGWRTSNTEGWRFQRLPVSRPLAPPARSSTGIMDSLNNLLSLPWSSLTRLVTWLFAALRPAGPYPILILSGPPASGKSTVANVLRALVDPVVSPLQALPKTEHELFVLALHNRILAFDHVPSLTREISVALARLASGSAFAHNGRNPYDDPLLLPIQRPVILTVPYTETTAAHWRSNTTVASLAITVQLDAILPQRMRSDLDIARDLQASAPSMLANLCDAVSVALANTTTAAGAPVSRFTDIQHWATLAARTLGIAPEDVSAALSASPLVKAIADLLGDVGEWSGNATDLLATLENRHCDGLPATARVLSEQLQSTPMALFGMQISFTRSNNERLIKLAMTQARAGASFSALPSVTN